jgi:glyoxylase-like metal-dependent hydrolase (beta-lactamase superfamily II)
MSKTTAFRAFFLLLFSAGLWLAVTQQQPPAPLTVTRIADDLHVIVGSGGNVAVYITDEGVILVDDKFEPNFPQILEKVKSLTDKPVRYVLNTHQHGDHTGGNAKFLGAGAEIVAHERARNNMAERNMPGVPRLSFSNRFSVRLGGKTVQLAHMGRGHTNGDAFMHFPAHRVVHTGDMFVAGAPFIDYSSGGSGLEWPQTISRVLAGLDFETVIPGHGPIMKREDLLKWKQSFETMNLQLTSLRREGKSKEDALQMAKTDALPGWGPSPNWGQRSFPGLWDEVAKK